MLYVGPKRTNNVDQTALFSQRGPTAHDSSLCGAYQLIVVVRVQSWLANTRNEALNGEKSNNIRFRHCLWTHCYFQHGALLFRIL